MTSPPKPPITWTVCSKAKDSQHAAIALNQAESLTPEAKAAYTAQAGKKADPALGSKLDAKSFGEKLAKAVESAPVSAKPAAKDKAAAKPKTEKPTVPPRPMTQLHGFSCPSTLADLIATAESIILNDKIVGAVVQNSLRDCGTRQYVDGGIGHVTCKNLTRVDEIAFIAAFNKRLEAEIAKVKAAAAPTPTPAAPTPQQTSAA